MKGFRYTPKLRSCLHSFDGKIIASNDEAGPGHYVPFLGQWIAGYMETEHKFLGRLTAEECRHFWQWANLPGKAPRVLFISVNRTDLDKLKLSKR
jgi:hypothetical protein